MKIYTVHSPKFEHNGETNYVNSCMFTSLFGFETYLNDKNPSYVYIYDISNVDIDDNLVHPCDGLDKVNEKIDIIFIRFKMFK